jgi:virginiamycin B lyase
MNLGRLLLIAALVSVLSLQPILTEVTTASPSNPTPPLYAESQYTIPGNSTQPGAITSDSAGNLWFVEQGTNQIGRFNPTTMAFSQFTIPIPNSLPQGIAVDASGNVWFAELGSNDLAELFRANSTIREISIPAGPDGLGCGPVGVTPNANGSVWFTCEFSNQIDEYIPSLNVVNQYNLPFAFSAPLQIVFDRSGNFWFTAADTGMLGYAIVAQLQPGTTAGIQEFAPLNETYVTTIQNSLLPSGGVKTSLAIPSQIALSPDGSSLWVTEHGAGSFDRYSIATKTLVKYFTTTPYSSAYSQSLPNGLVIDRAGEVWIAEHYGNRIAEFNPSTDAMTEYPVSCCGSGIAGTLYLTTGSGNTVWFTEFFGNAIGELKPVEGAYPPTAAISSRSLTMGTTGEASVSVQFTQGTGNGSTRNLAPEASGITFDGKFQNLTASFAPQGLTFGQNSSAVTTLTLQTNGLRPGLYYLTIGATSSTGVISSTILQLTITQGLQVVWVIGGAAIAGGVLLLVALVAKTRRVPSRRHRV